MKTENDFTPVIIKCAECKTVQAAIVEHTLPWNTHIHDSINCGYTIMESEWNVINPFVKLKQ